MTFSVAMNFDTGTGVIDPFRVTNNVGWGGAEDALDPNLVFSSLYPGAFADEFAWSDGGNPHDKSPRFDAPRRYVSYPLVLGIWVNAGSGERFYPGGQARAPNVPNGYWRLQTTCVGIGGERYRVGADIKTTFSPGYCIRSGTLRLYVIGYPAG